MDAREVAKTIGKYSRRQRYPDELDGPYAVKGIVLGGDEIERLEVGHAHERGYDPLVQITTGPEPRFEERTGSYLDDDGFSGTAWELSEQGCRRVTSLL